MLRDLTTRTNRRQGIAALLAIAGLAPTTGGVAKKRNRKGKKLGGSCQSDDQCVKADAICHNGAAAWCGDQTQFICCRDLGQSCAKDCDCCDTNKANTIWLGCIGGQCVDMDA